MEFTGYAIQDLIQTTSQTLFYRAVRESDRLSVILKTPRTEHPGPRERARYQREHELLRRLRGTSGVVTPHSLEIHRERPLLVLEDLASKAVLVSKDEPLAPLEMLALAIPLAATLAEVHRQGVIHKDIQPINLLRAEDGRVWLVNFSLATSRQLEHVEAPLSTVVEGALAYMSPEQSGRMNRPVDYRTDLYSFGVVLYQWLTGELPLKGRDALEWFHAHIAQVPPPPHQHCPAVPHCLSAVILKLLAKDADQRYQSAEGLRDDLERCQTMISRGESADFPLGLSDFPARFMPPQRLYGREQESESLHAAFERVRRDGRAEWVLVSGYSGIGKSSVVQELHRPILQHRGLFLSGKFNALARDVPYATLAQALGTLVQQMMAGSEEEVAHWRERLLTAFAGEGQLLLGLVPQLEQVVGPLPVLPDLPFAEARQRFNRLFQRLLGAVSAPERPLVLFLDDLQWADFASLELLRYLVTSADTPPLLLLGAYRDNEVSASHPLALTLAEVRKSPGRLMEIHLGPLTPLWTRRLVADALPGAVDAVVVPLAERLQEKTAGNPFFLLQLLRTLYQEGVVARAARGGWDWNEEALRARDYSDNVADFMAGRLRQLPAPSQRLLNLAACVGSSFSLETLALLSHQDMGEVERGLEEVLAEGFLVESGTQHYRFAHDRILQASYALVSGEQLEATHLEMGRRLWASLSPEALHEHLFDVVGQLNAGVRLMEDADERASLGRLNAEAGARARASAAYRSAVGYFAMAFQLLPGDPWKTAPVDAYTLRLEQARCELVSGNAPEARRLVEELLPRAPHRQAMAAGYQLKASTLLTLNQAQAASSCLLECLAHFGVHLPAQPVWDDVVTANQEVEALLGERPIESLVELPVMSDPDMKVAMQLLAALTWPAFFSNDKLLALHLCRMVAITLRHGLTPASASGFAWYGSILSSHFKRYHRGRDFAQLAHTVMERHTDSAYRGRTLFTVGNVRVWVEPMPVAMDLYLRAFEQSVQSGDFQVACFCCYFITSIMMLSGHDLAETSRELSARTDFANKVGFRQPEDMMRLTHYFVHQLRGLNDSFGSLNRPGFDEREFEAQLPGRMPALRFWFYYLQGRSRFLAGAFEEARLALDESSQVLWSMAGRIPIFDYYYYRPLVLAACCRDAPEARRAEYIEEMKAHQQQLAEWAANSPWTFRAAERLVSAELARVLGQTEAAAPLYEEAIQAAHDHGLIHDTALALELAARFWTERRLPTLARVYTLRAREAYVQWGAEGKVRHMDTQGAATGADPRAHAPAHEDSDATHLDALAVVKAQQAISSEIQQDALVATLMRVALEHAGAQRGALLLAQGGELKLEALVDTGAPEAANQSLPWSLLTYVRRAGEPVLIDDTAQPHAFSSDVFFTHAQARSVLCLPLMRKDQFHGLLYLENALTSHAFQSGRITLLQHLASHAAISMENARLYAEVQHAGAALRRANEELERRVEERTRELRQAQASLVQTARVAGMAEVAANVLHDVGNTLTSLVVDTEQMYTLVNESRMDRVAQVVGLLQEHRATLSDFVNQDAQGQQLFTYLPALATQLVREKNTLRRGLEDMTRNVEHVRTIVNMQQQYPKATLLEEECSLVEVVEESLRLNTGVFKQAGIDVTRDLSPLPVMKVDRHRLLQILMNLMSNARHAMEAIDAGRRVLRVRLSADTRWVRIEVEDSGHGLTPEARQRLFSQGFTTREGGHGIGLHASSLAAQLMGGELRLESEGPGRGATATLLLPVSSVRGTS